MSVNNIFNVKEHNAKQSYYELYKELDLPSSGPQILNNQKRIAFPSSNKASNSSSLLERFKSWVACHDKAQAEALKNAMKVVVISGQCVGLLPVDGVLEKDVTIIKFEVRSVRFVLSVLMWLSQTFAMLLCLYRLVTYSMNVNRLGYFSFYTTTWLTSTVFLRLATVVPDLMKLVVEADLNEYIDPYVKAKCIVATVALFCSGIFEHFLALIFKITEAINCSSTSEDMFKILSENMFPWIFEAGIPYYSIFGCLLLVMNFVSTIIWNYSHLFIVCVSIYLASVLKQINKKVLQYDGEYTPSSFWKKLREDYSRATQLIRSFDDFINNIVFVSFASNLFFVCLRLYHTLSRCFKDSQPDPQQLCPENHNGPFNGHVVVMYIFFSLIFVIVRSLVVCLAAAQIHTESLAIRPVLYNVPSACYCQEVQRFIEQVHGDKVALSGLNFFYVTNELVLTIAGTIVTYELVLLQLN